MLSPPGRPRIESRDLHCSPSACARLESNGVGSRGWTPLRYGLRLRARKNESWIRSVATPAWRSRFLARHHPPGGQISLTDLFIVATVTYADRARLRYANRREVKHYVQSF